MLLLPTIRKLYVITGGEKRDFGIFLEGVTPGHVLFDVFFRFTIDDKVILFLCNNAITRTIC